MNLERRSDSAPEEVPIRIENPVEVRVDHVATTGTSKVAKPTTYEFRYRNEGNRIARDVKIVNPIPPGTRYRSGSAVILNKKAGQSIDTSKANTVVFNLGDVQPESSGVVRLTVDVKSSVLDLASPQVVNRPYMAGGGVTPAADPSGGPVPAAGEAKGFIREDRNPVDDPSIPKMFLARIAPQSVQKGGEIHYRIVVGNASSFAVGGSGIVRMQIPDGAEFIDSSAGNTLAGNNRSFLVFLDEITGTPGGKFPAHSAFSFTVVLRATGPVGKVIQDPTCYLQANALNETYVPPAATLIIEGSASSSTNRVEIAGAQLGALGIDASVAMLDDRVAAAVGNINDNSVNTRIGGASYVQMTNGATLIPLLGDDKILAIGPASFIGNDGSTLIGNDGSTLVAAGGGNLITFNGLIGNDGSTLVGQDGSAIMAKIRTNDPANLVAAGAGNLVAAGGGNLIGNDGSTLVGNDGASLATIGVSSAERSRLFWLPQAGGTFWEMPGRA